MVALTVLSLIMLATVSALRTFARTQSSVDQLTSRVEEIRTVSQLLRAAVESAIAEDGSVGGLTLGGVSGDPARFVGTSEYAEWKTAVVFGENYGGVYDVRVAREGDALVLRWREPSARLRREPWEDSLSKELVRPVEEFAVAFRPEYGEAWVAQWQSSRPPAAVRFTLRSAGRYWPELVIQVQR
jgi:general secretion pathway protein J